MPDIDTNRLAEAYKFSRKKLEPFRKERRRIIDQYVGGHYGEGGGKTAAGRRAYPVNRLAQAVQVYSQLLASNNPAARVTTRKRALRASAEKLRLVLNHDFKETALGKALNTCVTDAMFGMGIMMTGVNRTEREHQGYIYDVGQPFAMTISLDDWVQDMNAKTGFESTFMGNRFRIPVDDARDIFDDKDLEPTPLTHLNAGGDERDKSLETGSSSGDKSEFLDFIELQYLWLPRSNQLTIWSFKDGGHTLDRQLNRDDDEWKGPENGPYRILGFHDVPGALMPLPPSYSFVDLNEISNRDWRKLNRQAENAKTITAYSDQGGDTASTIQNAKDGDGVSIRNPKDATRLEFGGPMPTLLAFYLTTRDELSQMAGNLDSLAGLGPQSDTASQDRLIAESASRLLQGMQERTVAFARETMEDLAWYRWYDPITEITLSQRIPNTDIEVDVTFSPDEREGDFLDYNVDIEPFSLRARSPQEKALFLREEFQMAAQLGIQADTEAYYRLQSELNNIPELLEIFPASNPNETAPLGSTPRNLQNDLQSGGGTRVIERNTRVGATRQGNNQQMVSALLGQNRQPSEQAAVGRGAA